MKYTITLADEEVGKIQVALDQENALRRDAGLDEFKDVATFIQAEVEERFGFAVQTEKEERQQAISAIVESLKAVPTDKLADVATAVDTVAKPVDVKPAPVEGAEPLTP